MPWRVALAAVSLIVAACASPTVTRTQPATTQPTAGATPTPTPSATPTPPISPPPTTGGVVVHPPACGDAVLEWDGDRLLLAACVSQVDPAPTEQVWAFDTDGWSLVSDDGPPPVVVTGAAWDPERSVLLRYGGLPMDSNNCVAETWEWDGVTWSRRPTTMTRAPSPATT